MWLLVADSQIRDRQLLCTFNQRIGRISVHGLTHEHQAHRAVHDSPIPLFASDHSQRRVGHP